VKRTFGYDMHPLLNALHENRMPRLIRTARAARPKEIRRGATLVGQGRLAVSMNW